MPVNGMADYLCPCLWSAFWVHETLPDGAARFLSTAIGDPQRVIALVGNAAIANELLAGPMSLCAPQ
jgi:hypothetical protein